MYALLTLDEFGLLSENLGATAATIEEKYVLLDGDLLIARSGNTVGKAYLHTWKGYPCFFAGYMIRFKINKDVALPSYVFTITQLGIYKEWVKAVQRSAGQPNINAEEYRSYKIPLPPFEIQRQIVSKMNAAYDTKKQKEAQAQQLLDSIDIYLLSELGIELPVEEENSINQRMFFRKSSEVSGGRFDSYFYKIKFVELSHKIINSKFGSIQLGKVCNSITNGFDNRDFSSTGLPYVKVANIRPYEITPDLFQCINIDTPDRVSLMENDILLTRKGSFGMAARVSNFTDYAICSEIFKLRLNNEKNAHYIEAILNSRICQIQFDQLKIGAIMGSLTQDVIKKVLIPLPPLEKQNSITNHIQTIRNQAKQLRAEAAAGLEQAKQEVEAMMLGQQ